MTQKNLVLKMLMKYIISTNKSVFTVKDCLLSSYVFVAQLSLCIPNAIKFPTYRQYRYAHALNHQVAKLKTRSKCFQQATLCAELNCPSLPHVKEWARKHSPVITPNWKASCSLQPTGSMFRGNEYAVFLYNSSFGIRISRTSLLEKSSTPRSVLRKSFTRSPCGASCHIQSTKLVLISVHLKASGLRNSQIGQTISEIQSLGYLVQAFYETQPSGTHLIIAGDFNLFPTHEVYRALYDHGLWPVLDGEQRTSVSRSKGGYNNIKAYDNAWLSADLSLTSDSGACWTGDSGVIVKGLRHPLIPEETGGANGFVSDHAPIWFDIRVQ
ncbi:unnamed protein product [Trichobilharzia szidati]|nr:unnamed protein product [Trichobilharzia szidati]